MKLKNKQITDTLFVVKIFVRTKYTCPNITDRKEKKCTYVYSWEKGTWPNGNPMATITSWYIRDLNSFLPFSLLINELINRSKINEWNNQSNNQINESIFSINKSIYFFQKQALYWYFMQQPVFAQRRKF